MTIYDPTEEFCGCGHDDDELLGEQTSLGEWVSQQGGNAQDAVDGNAAKIQEAMFNAPSDDDLARELIDEANDHIVEMGNHDEGTYKRRFHRATAEQIKELADNLESGMRRTSVRGQATGRLNRAERKISSGDLDDEEIAEMKGLREAARTVHRVLEGNV